MQSRACSSCARGHTCNCFDLILLLTIPAYDHRLAEALEMDEGGGGAVDHGGADSYYGDADYGDEKMRQVSEPLFLTSSTALHPVALLLKHGSISAP